MRKASPKTTTTQSPSRPRRAAGSARSTGRAKSGANVSRDPHALARIFLDYSGKTTPGAEIIRFYRDQYYQWNGLRYESLRLSELRAQVTKAVQQEFLEKSDGNGSPAVTTSMVANVMQSIASITLVPGNLQQPVMLGSAQPRKLVSMANGLLDLDALLESGRSGLLPHTPKWFSTVSLPYEYDANATCPRWKHFLGTVLEDDDKRINLLQEWFGYCLTPDTSEQKFLILEGEGANGKSVVCGLLEAVLGKANVSHVPLENFAQRFALTSTIGKLANIATEVSHLEKVAEGYLKQFTSGDRMNFDRKGLSPVEETPTARLVLALNNRPHFSDPTGALARRMTLLPFRVIIPPGERDKHLTETLRAELSGIFNWAVEGELRRRKRGAFTESKVCSEALSSYRYEMSPARQFLEENVETDANCSVKSQELYDAYREWCALRGEKPIADTAFGKEVKRVFGIEKHKGSSGTRKNYYPGVRLPALNTPGNLAYLEDKFLASVGVST